MMMSRSLRVLSIQSHVVHGCVGNRAAVLPLQLLDLETDVLNTVQFSNTPDTGSFSGEKLDGDQLWQLMQGMHENGLLKPSHLLTGYMGSVGAVRAVLRALPLLPPNVEFWCDPVRTIVLDFSTLELIFMRSDVDAMRPLILRCWVIMAGSMFPPSWLVCTATR